MEFSELKLVEPIQKTLAEEGYKKPTPIQQQSIPIVLAKKDLLGIAQTGTGKTAAFCLPILNHLFQNKKPRISKAPRALILTPTRELAVQIHESLKVYGRYLQQRYAVIFGGVGQGLQVRDLQQGVDVLVATPGRLLDLINQRYVALHNVEFFVLDEADRMLDMGFIQDIKRILPLIPKDKQSLFFSATMPKEVTGLAQSILQNPSKVEVTPPSTTVSRIDQKVFYVDKKDKGDLLLHLLKDEHMFKVLVFVEMKHFADRVCEKLQKNGIPTAAIHGNKSQNQRQRAIQDFTNDKIRVLVATDIASRGIDIDGITHVVNFELSHLPESYVHRIGRTARAGQSGASYSFVNSDEKSYLAAIEYSTRQKIPVIVDHPFHSEVAKEAAVTGVGKAKAKIEGVREQGRRPSKGFRGRFGKSGNKSGGKSFGSSKFRKER